MEDDAPKPLDEVVAARRAMARPGTARRMAFGFSLLLCVAAIPVLIVTGYRAVLDRSDGQLIDTTRDPAAPGFQALVAPTPTLLAVTVGDDGTVVDIAVLVETGRYSGGSVVLVPSTLLVAALDGSSTNLGSVHAEHGIDATMTAVEAVLGVGVDNGVVLTSDDWEAITAATARLVVDNPDEMVLEDPAGREHRIEPTRVSLAPNLVGGYLAEIGDDEAELARLFRHEQFYTGVLDSIAVQPPDPTDTVEDSPVGQVTDFLVNLASGTTSISRLPVLEVPGASEHGPQLVADDAEVGELVADVVQYPIGLADGSWITVRVLDGSRRPEVALEVTRLLGPTRAQVTIFGNADHFDYRDTIVLISREEARVGADRLVDVLGTGRVVLDEAADNAVDATVVLGADFELPDRPARREGRTRNEAQSND